MEYDDNNMAHGNLMKVWGTSKAVGNHMHVWITEAKEEKQLAEPGTGTPQ